MLIDNNNSLEFKRLSRKHALTLIAARSTAAKKDAVWAIRASRARFVKETESHTRALHKAKSHRGSAGDCACTVQSVKICSASKCIKRRDRDRERKGEGGERQRQRQRQRREERERTMWRTNKRWEFEQMAT